MDDAEKYACLEKAIVDYEHMVHQKSAALKRGFIKDLTVLVILPVVAGIIVGQYSNLVAVLGIVGVSGVNLSQRLQNGTTLLTKYWDAKSKVERTVPQVKMELHSCTRTDRPCLDAVQTLLRSYAASLYA
ncbi:MAG: hypothetical protein JW846_04915 [Dehalococcoidia bacterium]|nr:hypothetical protein [Dehalococcoidia bacterium]